MIAVRLAPFAPLLLMVAELGGGSACSSSSGGCVADGTITVQVRNQAVDSDQNFICNATVTATAADGGAKIDFAAQGGTEASVANCIYVAQVAPGAYTITASATGFQSLSQTETITSVNCVAGSPEVAFPLAPIGQ